MTPQQNQSVAGVLVPILAVLLWAGCSGERHHDHEHAHEESGHNHDARHGGVPVVLGDEVFHVEFTYAETPGVLQAYIFDGHMENYVRIAAPSFVAEADVAGRKQPLVFQAVPNDATGETIGNSALFEATAEWLRERPAVHLVVPQLEVRGNTFTNVTIELPAGAPVSP